MPELLIELFSEEIPARMQARAAEDLCSELQKSLKPREIVPSGPVRSFHGPRRIGLVLNLPMRSPDSRDETKGPQATAPEQARRAFVTRALSVRTYSDEDLAGAALNEIDRNGFYEYGDAVEGIRFDRREVAGKAYYFATRSSAGRETAAEIADFMPLLLRRFPWPKSMRWGSSPFLWVRPLQRVLCLFGGEAVRFPLGDAADPVHGLVAGDATEGHRVLSPGAFAVRGFADYQAGLRERHVILDAAERARVISDGIAALGAAEGVTPVPDAGLLAEVAGLVEWPVPLLGRIDAAYMDLPSEVLRTSMRVNQRYFSYVDAAGRAAPFFGVVANITPRDGGAAIVAGNERVLRARLADARFFWDQDRKVRLEDWLPKLDAVTYFEKLGSQGERARRLETLAAHIAPLVGADAALAARASRLAKADLVTGMVGEFPELQGVMGSYYARAQGEPPEVAAAIAEHYRPMGPGDAVPSAPVSIAVALADKLDQLAGFFAVGEKPSGSGDPFALRRAALGVIRIVRENGLRLGLRTIMEPAYAGVRRSIVHVKAVDIRERRKDLETVLGHELEEATLAAGSFTNINAFTTEILDFLLDRLRVQLRAESARHDVVAAILGATPDDDINRLLARAKALRALLETEAGTNLLAAFRRAQNILRIEEKKDGAPAPVTVDPALLTAPEEQALHAALATTEATVAASLAAEDFAGAMAALAALRPPLDAFFERVIVNDKAQQIRANRLALLSAMRSAMEKIADFTKIEGQGANQGAASP